MYQTLPFLVVVVVIWRVTAVENGTENYTGIACDESIVNVSTPCVTFYIT